MGLDAHINRRGVSEDCAELSDRILRKRLGNIALIAFLREWISDVKDAAQLFPIILGAVLYSGTHSGDEIALSDIPALERELKQLANSTHNDAVISFVSDMRELCAASIETDNPIVF
jgi:hypothetical protein